VLLADDNEFVRESLTDLLTASGLQVVGACQDGRDVVAAAQRTQPEVVVLDLAMPYVDGLEATHRLLAAQPGTRVIILTATLSDSAVAAARRLGACGYVLKTEGPQLLLEAIRTVAAGGTAWWMARRSPAGEGVHPEPETHDMA
jgi:DNA-binding NarL/FixJ family response regulator